MNKQIYEKNMNALEKKYPAWAEKISQTTRKKRNFDVIIEQALMGETILKVKKDGKQYYLNGKYAPSAPMERWLEKQGILEDYAVVIIIGISNGVHINHIIEKSPKTTILVYEPSFEIFRRAIEEVDLSFLFQLNIPVGIIVDGLNDGETSSYFRMLISYDNMTFLKYYISGNYKKLFYEKIDCFIKKLRQHVSGIDINWNTILRYTDVRAQNVFHNLHYLYEGYSVDSLIGILPSDIPAIIVSAGPSLNKNIMDLRKAVGKACIIATDTAMKPLLNAGIIPNLFVIIDGLKPGILFEHKNLSKVPMVTMTGVSVKPMDYHKGKKFFYYSDAPFEHHILLEISENANETKTVPYINTGGSVATTAYSLGIAMGASTVILVGQDLALTGNRTHADGTFQDKMDEIDTESGAYFEVEAIDGGKVLTRGDFKNYLNWFEERVKEWDYITTIDATEGGALIHGTKTMTLKKAITKYCRREYNVKWHIDHTKKLLTNKEKTVMLEYFLNSEKKLQEVQKKAKEGICYYEKLETLLHKPTLAEKEIQKTLKRIKKINNYMEDDYMARTVTDSLKGLEFILRPSIYQIQEDKKAELLDVAKQGKVMLHGVDIAAEEICEIAQNTIVKYAKEHLLGEDEENKEP